MRAYEFLNIINIKNINESIIITDEDKRIWENPTANEIKQICQNIPILRGIFDFVAKQVFLVDAKSMIHHTLYHYLKKEEYLGSATTKHHIIEFVVGAKNVNFSNCDWGDDDLNKSYKKETRNNMSIIWNIFGSSFEIDKYLLNKILGPIKLSNIAESKSPENDVIILPTINDAPTIAKWISYQGNCRGFYTDQDELVIFDSYGNTHTSMQRKLKLRDLNGCFIFNNNGKIVVDIEVNDGDEDLGNFFINNSDIELMHRIGKILHLSRLYLERM